MSGKTGSAPPPRKSTTAQGKTLPSRLQRSKPRLPHERDSSSDSQTGTQDPRIEQAARDVEKGLKDTGRGPVINKLARAQFPPTDAEEEDGDENPGKETARSHLRPGKA